MKSQHKFAVILWLLFSNAAFSNELSKYGSWQKETYNTTYKEYIEYLDSGFSKKTDGFSCLQIKLDYLDYVNKMLENERGYVRYYYQEDMIVFDDIIFSDNLTKTEFEDAVRDVPMLLKGANNPKGRIPSDSLYLAVLTRLFSKYEIWIDAHKFSVDLTKYKKCKDYYGGDHQ